MRVISGTAKGRKLHSVPGKDTRPITDRVKEALFNIVAPDIVGSTWWDVFAGTGAVGIEALSRGAAYARLTDLHRGPLGDHQVKPGTYRPGRTSRGQAGERLRPAGGSTRPPIRLHIRGTAPVSGALVPGAYGPRRQYWLANRKRLDCGSAAPQRVQITGPVASDRSRQQTIRNNSAHVLLTGRRLGRDLEVRTYFQGAVISTLSGSAACPKYGSCQAASIVLSIE